MLENLGGKIGIEHTLGGTKRQRDAGFQVACLLENTLKRVGCVQSDRGAVHTSQHTALGTFGTSLGNCTFCKSGSVFVSGFTSQTTLGNSLSGFVGSEFLNTFGGDLFTYHCTRTRTREQP